MMLNMEANNAAVGNSFWRHIDKDAVTFNTL